jgi:hypothetical protein
MTLDAITVHKPLANFIKELFFLVSKHKGMFHLSF